MPLEALAARTVLVVGLQAADDERALRLGEELGRIGEVLQNRIGDEGDGYGDEPLDDEDPRPSALTTHPVHVGDGGGEEASEGARDGGGAVHLPPLISRSSSPQLRG